MNGLTTKTINTLEQNLEATEGSAIRQRVLQNAKHFKTSWIDLGQSLYAVWKDKLYKGWGYSTFDTYTAKEIGIRKQTAVKLLKSYYFLEQKEPRYTQKEYTHEMQTASVPTYESIDILRKASNQKDLDEESYQAIKKNVLEEGKDAQTVKKDLTSLIKQREELLPEEAWQKKRTVFLRRLISTLKTVSEEIKMAKLFPVKIMKEVDKLISNLEMEIPPS